MTNSIRFPIPDLTKPGKVSRDNAGELEKFVRGLIVEEFNGIEPPENAVKAISVYIRALCQDCESDPQPIALDTHWKRAERALILAEKISSD